MSSVTNDICVICQEEFSPSNPDNPKIRVEHRVDPRLRLTEKQVLEKQKQFDKTNHCFDMYCIGKHCQTSNRCPLCRELIVRVSVDDDLVSDIQKRDFSRINSLFKTGLVSEDGLGRAVCAAVSYGPPSLVADLLQRGPISYDARGDALCRAIIEHKTGVAYQIYDSGQFLEEKFEEARHLAKQNGLLVLERMMRPAHSCTLL